MSTPSRPADYRFHVTGMMCQQNCAATVQRAISTVKGVECVEVSFPNEEALVWGDAEVSYIITEVEDMGYEAVLKNPAASSTNSTNANTAVEPPPDLTLAIKGMFDGKICPSKVHALVTAVDGVFNVKVNFDKKTCQVWGFADASVIIDSLATEGYGARDASTPETNLVKRGPSPPSSSAAVASAERLILNLDKLLRKANLKAVESALKGLPHVRSVQVDVEGRTLAVFAAPGFTAQVTEGITKLNYADALIATTTSASAKREYMFEVTGMSCANCAMKIEKAIMALAACDHPPCEVAVSSMTNKAKVLIRDPTSSVGPRDITEKVTAMGYGCTLHGVDGVSVAGHGDSGDAQENNELGEWYIPLVVSLILGIPVMVLHLSMASSNSVMMMFDMPAACSGGVTYMQAVMFLLNLPILLIVGYRYYKGAVIGAMHGNFGMDCLVTTGTSITFLYSCVQVSLACHSHVPTKHVFFETTGMLLMFVTIGKFIEAYAKRRSFAAISNLLKLQPREAILVVQPEAAPAHGGDSRLTLQSGTPAKVRAGTTATAGTAHSPLTTAAATPGAPGAAPEETRVISLDLVQRGDLLKVFPGDRIPTDGVVAQGSSFVDEAMITGESLPVMKKKGDVVFGSTVNQNNLLYVTVTSLGSESALAQIVKLVEAAQMNKAPVQAYADRIAGVFTPIILVLAAVTFAVWCGLSVTHIVPASWYSDEHNDPYLFSMIFAISVVVISCPCALGLATPTAIMAGTSVGAANGILIKGGSAFETAHKVDTVIFDKTGTLTEGKPAITDVVVLRPQRKGSISPMHVLEENTEQQLAAQDELLRLAATAEQGSDHPLSRAILEAARGRNLILPSLTEDATVSYVGSGVRCDIGAGVVLVGNRALMEEQQVSVSPLLDAAMWDLEIQGKTAVCVAVDGAIRGVLGLADTAKAEAFSTIKALRAMGLDVWMVTGDNRTTAEALAEELELPKERILAGVLPKDKVSKVQELQAQGKHVAMVGDGINDSPALAQADLGIAIGAGTEVAIEAADMVLIRSNLHDLVVALDLARLVFSRIKQNFVWAMIYNLLAVPYAAGIWFPWTHLVLPPQYAGLSMAASSVSVVVSSMMLWLYKRPAVLSDDPNVPRSGGSMFQRAKRGIAALKDTISDKLSGNGRRSSGSGSFEMGVLRSASLSTASLSSVGSDRSAGGVGGGSAGGGAAYKQLARSENEAELGGASQYVL